MSFDCAPKSGPTLRVGLNPWPGYEVLFIAEHVDYFRDEGVAVRLIEFTSLSDCRRAYERDRSTRTPSWR